MDDKADHEIDNGHILDEDGICWCDPDIIIAEDGSKIYVHKDTN